MSRRELKKTADAIVQTAAQILTLLEQGKVNGRDFVVLSTERTDGTFRPCPGIVIVRKAAEELPL